jgi:diguanylate cyclase (GGDEF)-like protein
MSGFPILGFFLMFRWTESIETLTKGVKSKVIQLIEGEEELKDENEIMALQQTFNIVYHELQEKVDQVNEYSKKLVNANMQLSKKAITDDLTTLYNPRYFDLRLQEEISRSKRYNHELSLIMFDIDDFKKFNDMYGHQVGDNLLYAMGLLIKDSIREADIAFRYREDEFAIILPECSVEAARITANRLVNIVSSHMFKDRQERSLGKVTISCGVSCYINDLEEFVKEAHNLLYQAKQAGTSQVRMKREKNIEIYDYQPKISHIK